MHAASVYAESDRERVSKQERARVVEKVGEEAGERVGEGEKEGVTLAPPGLRVHLCI